MDWVDPFKLVRFQLFPITNDTDKLMATFYKASADQLHRDFILLQELTDTDSTYWRKVIIEELQGIQSAAKKLLEMNTLHELDNGRLKHIIQRDLTQFIVFARHRERLNHMSLILLRVLISMGYRPYIL